MSGNMGDVCMISIEGALYGSYAFFNTTVSSSVHRGAALCRQFLVSLESSDKHSLLVAQRLNTTKYLGVST
jgi:hypothetical protein